MYDLLYWTQCYWYSVSNAKRLRHLMAAAAECRSKRQKTKKPVQLFNSELSGWLLVRPPIHSGRGSCADMRTIHRRRYNCDCAFDGSSRWGSDDVGDTMTSLAGGWVDVTSLDDCDVLWRPSLAIIRRCRSL